MDDLEYYIMQYLILILVYCVKYYIYLKNGEENVKEKIIVI